MISYSDLVPMLLQDELISLRDEMTRDSWRVADITEMTIDFNLSNHREFEYEDIYRAVGMFVGKASRTIREYHHIGRFFPLEIREQFSMLAFDHFRHAVCLGERSIRALQWAHEQTDILGRPASVDAMVAKFAIPQPGMPEPPPDMDEGRGGIYLRIYENVLVQREASEVWINQPDIPAEIMVHLKTYHWAASQLVEMLGEVRK